MSRRVMMRRVAGIAVAGLVIGLVGAGFALSLGTTTQAQSAGSGREIVLVARSMAYYLPGDPRPNPTLTVAPGEAVRLVLINEDAGMQHDVAIPDLAAATRVLSGRGSTAVAFRAPSRTGEHEYLCTLHATLMRGTLHVR